MQILCPIPEPLSRIPGVMGRGILFKLLHKDSVLRQSLRSLNLFSFSSWGVQVQEWFALEVRSLLAGDKVTKGTQISWARVQGFSLHFWLAFTFMVGFPVFLATGQEIPLWWWLKSGHWLVEPGPALHWCWGPSWVPVGRRWTLLAPTSMLPRDRSVCCATFVWLEGGVGRSGREGGGTCRKQLLWSWRILSMTLDTPWSGNSGGSIQESVWTLCTVRDRWTSWKLARTQGGAQGSWHNQYWGSERRGGSP